jgi:hypothetical protein
MSTDAGENTRYSTGYLMDSMSITNFWIRIGQENKARFLVLVGKEKGRQNEVLPPGVDGVLQRP